MSRAESLVATAKLRAQITACVEKAEKVLTIAEIAERLGFAKGEDVTKSLFNLIYRMADNGLLAKVPIDDPDYTYGYAPARSLQEAPERKRPAKEQAKETPIDVRINKRQGSITIRYAGLLITLSKED